MSKINSTEVIFMIQFAMHSIETNNKIHKISSIKYIKLNNKDHSIKMLIKSYEVSASKVKKYNQIKSKFMQLLC